GDDVVTRVAVELVPPAGPDPGLAGQVIDDVRTLQRGREIGVDEVELFEREVAMALRHLEVLLLASAAVVVGEAVDADHLLAVGEQALAEVRADEPRGAGDDGLHRTQACGVATVICNRPY